MARDDPAGMIVEPERLRVAVKGTVPPVTLTVTELEVVFAPSESVAIALNNTAPETPGVHVAVYGATVSVLRGAPFTKNWTLWIARPVAAVALAEMVNGVPAATDAPDDGEVMATVAPPAMVTLSGDDVKTAPLESVARAVSETVPLVLGNQSNKYGDVLVEPIRVVPE
jgi:hypothetical protein